MPRDGPAVNHRRPFIRNFDADVHFEIFTVAAVAAILAIRLYLKVTGYPQLAGGSLHIAHMLWGGLLMVIALIMLLAFLNRDVVRLAAVVGGVGFGTFLDEIGKIITRDNDYFFEPAVAVIYIVLVLMALAVNAVLRRMRTPEESLLNALQELEELALQDLDLRERGRALRLLAAADPRNPLVPTLREILLRASESPGAQPGRYVRLRSWLRERYDALAVHPRFRAAVVVFFVGQLAVKIVTVIVVVFFPWVLRSPTWPPPTVTQRLQDHSVADWVQLASIVLSGVFVGLGVLGLTRSRVFAYRMFKRSVLVSIFITQVFMFYQEQLSAVIGLALNMLLLVALQAALDLERARLEDTSSGSASDA